MFLWEKHIQQTNSKLMFMLFGLRGVNGIWKSILFCILFILEDLYLKNNTVEILIDMDIIKFISMIINYE